MKHICLRNPTNELTHSEAFCLFESVVTADLYLQLHYDLCFRIQEQIKDNIYENINSSWIEPIL